jgi:phosphoglucomutase
VVSTSLLTEYGLGDRVVLMKIPEWLIESPPGHHPDGVSPSAVAERFAEYIVSSSGIRAVMAPGGEEDAGEAVSPVDLAIAFLVGYAGAEFLRMGRAPGATVVVGRDSRPTGDALARGLVAGALASQKAAGGAGSGTGLPVRYLGVCPSPQIMAYSRGLSDAAGFLYATASHNPVGHNGYKIGGSAGGVLDSYAFRRFAELLKNRLESLGTALAPGENPPEEFLRILSGSGSELLASEREYRDFLLRTVFDTPDLAGASKQAELVATEKTRQPMSLVIDFNGSARAAGPDAAFFRSLGVEVTTLHDTPGQIAHQILPEGPGLADCIAAVERLAAEAEAASGGNAEEPLYLGYVPDNDGDRGNIVVYNSESRRAEAVHPQSLLALAALSELGYAAAGGQGKANLAIVANGPTSLRLDRVAESLGAAVHRSEVGEANVVALGEELRRSGLKVRVMGEGSNGGVIIHPSGVRDPILTLGALIKLLRLPELAGPGTTSGFGLRVPGDAKADPLSRLYAQLPPFLTTQTGEPEAILRLSKVDHPRLKDRYEALAEARWYQVAESVLSPLGISRFRWINYEGTKERPGRGNRSPEATGGLKLQLEDPDETPRGFLWFRGSKTEPLMRLMVDLEGDDREAHRKLMAWHRGLLLEAAAES